MTYAVPQDVAEALRGSTSVTAEEAVQWQAWLDRVERGVIAAFRRAGTDLAEQIALGTLTADDVADVEVAAVIRKIQNPTWGRTSQTRSLDDGSVTYRNEGAGANVDPLALLPGELGGLLPGSSVSGFSVRPYFEPDGLPYPLDWS